MAEFSENFEMPVVSPASTMPAIGIHDPNHETRQEYFRRAAEAAGITWPSTILPEGTALYDSGVEKLKADRAKWRKLPNAREALVVVKAALAAEDRKDIPDVPVSELRLHETNGRLYRAGATANGKDRKALASGYDSHAFRQLIGQIPDMAAGSAPRGFASSLLYLTDAERAGIVNARIGKSEKKVMLRTKLSHSGSRIVRAVLSERYADVSDIHTGEAIEYGLNGGLDNVKLDYRPGDSASQFELLFPSEVPVKTFRVGDVHYGFVAISNSETGQGSIKVRPGLFRAACANLTLAAGEGVEVSIRHMGDVARVRLQMRSAIAQAVAQIEPLVHAIQDAAAERLDSFTSKSPTEILAAIGAKFAVAPARIESWTKTYVASYAMSPTTWGVTSAITEAAQSQSWWKAQQEEEEIAGKLLQVGLRRSLEGREMAVVRR